MFSSLSYIKSTTPKFKFTMKKVIDDLTKKYRPKSLLLPQEIIFSPELVLTDIYIRGLHVSETSYLMLNILFSRWRGRYISTQEKNQTNCNRHSIKSSNVWKVKHCSDST